MSDLLTPKMVGEQLRDLRKSEGVTLRALAHTIGCNESHLSLIEHGVSGLHSIRTIRDYASACGYDVRLVFTQVRRKT